VYCERFSKNFFSILVLQSPELPAALAVLHFPVGAFTVSRHLLRNVDRKTSGFLAVGTVPDFLIAVRTLSPHSLLVFLDNEF
jgi:hypothetical protein